MNIIFFLRLVFIMLFLHTIADYNLQGILASMKQKKWWNDTYKVDIDKTIYKNDYKIALFMHSFAWSFIICLPFLFYKADLYFVIVTAINTFIHFNIDNTKANKLTINLVQDQSFHIIQIIITALVYTFIR